MTPSAAQEGSSSLVYGNDDRLDPYEVGDTSIADAVRGFDVALMTSDAFDTSNPEAVTFLGDPLGTYVCSDERFANQITAASCSGTLIGPDLILTAGHCIDRRTCASTHFVFGYEHGAAGQQSVTTADIFGCSEIVAHASTDTLDYAVIRTDRVVEGRTPAAVRAASTAIPTSMDLVLAGHPSGLPVKIAADARVLDNRASTRDYFEATVDAFSGNSGSGVFDASSLELVGILVRGNTDYVFDARSDCYRVNVCPQGGCPGGEDCTYAFRALNAACAAGAGPSIPGCTCGNGVCDGEESTTNCPPDCGSSCGDGVCNGNEHPGSCTADCGRPPASCAEVTVIEATDQILTGSTARARDTIQPSCIDSTGGREVVYELTLTSPDRLRATSRGFDTVLYIGEWCGAGDVACNDDHDPVPANGSYLDVDLDPGTYYLVVDGYSASSFGTFELRLDFGSSSLGLGQSCSSDKECESGHCADRVCCDTSCGNGVDDCQACSVAAGADRNGSCQPLAAGTVCRPRAGGCDVAERCDGITSACPLDELASSDTICRPATGACDLPERCTGSSPVCPADALAPPHTPCRVSNCAHGIESREAHCTGVDSTCPASENASCGDYQCGKDACLSSCRADTDCAAGRYCDGGLCAPLDSNGTPCLTSTSCASGQCVDGFCCDSGCDDSCTACDVAGREGICVGVTGVPRGARRACPSGSMCRAGSCVDWPGAGGQGGLAGSAGAAGYGVGPLSAAGVAGVDESAGSWSRAGRNPGTAGRGSGSGGWTGAGTGGGGRAAGGGTETEATGGNPSGATDSASVNDRIEGRGCSCRAVGSQPNVPHPRTMLFAALAVGLVVAGRRRQRDWWVR